MECYSVLDCSVDVESFTSSGASGKRVNHKNACVQLGRNQFNDLVFKLNNTAYTLKDFKVLDRFKQDGKATLLFQKPRLNLMISNAPPNALIAFLKLMRVKAKIQSSFASDRTKLHSKEGKTFEEISPLTVQDIKKYKDVACLKSPNTPPANNKNSTQGVGAGVKRKTSSKVTDITPVRSKKRSLEVSSSAHASSGSSVGGKPCKRLNMGGNSGRAPQVSIYLIELRCLCIYMKEIVTRRYYCVSIFRCKRQTESVTGDTVCLLLGCFHL